MIFDDNIMTNNLHQCDSCKKEFKYKSQLLKHLQRKKPCTPFKEVSGVSGVSEIISSNHITQNKINSNEKEIELLKNVFKDFKNEQYNVLNDDNSNEQIVMLNPNFSLSRKQLIDMISNDIRYAHLKPMHNVISTMIFNNLKKYNYEST
jgi:hypothetical protein